MLTDLTYLAYPLPEDIERLVYTGDLSRALRVIEMRLANDKVPQALKNRLRFEERIIREIPLSYNVSEGEMLVQLQSAFRDFQGGHGAPARRGHAGLGDDRRKRLLQG